MEACVLLYELVFLSKWKEQSSSKHLLPAKKRHRPNSAQYWCFLFLFCFMLSLLTCVEKLPFLDQIPLRRNRCKGTFISFGTLKKGAGFNKKYYLILLKLLIDTVIKWYVCQEARTSWRGWEMTFSSRTDKGIYAMFSKIWLFDGIMMILFVDLASSLLSVV